MLTSERTCIEVRPKSLAIKVCERGLTVLVIPLPLARREGAAGDRSVQLGDDARRPAHERCSRVDRGVRCRAGGQRYGGALRSETYSRYRNVRSLIRAERDFSRERRTRNLPVISSNQYPICPSGIGW